MTTAHDYSEGIDPEHALKYAIQRWHGDRSEIVEGILTQLTPSWDHERAAKLVRRQIEGRVDELGCVEGSGNLDLPGSANWYVPDIAVVPEDLAQGGSSLLPDQTLLIVEVTSKSNAETDRVVKRKRYAEYGAPLYLLVDRLEKTVTLFGGPGRLGYTDVDGPHPFGTPVHLPAPFDLDLDTSGL
ncbi:Uma2 family endonuclease [Streptomyces sp. ISL-43]|uniref:Uma2 family endonuclease n=1 Tax=Streptomyces sp. ISL-43 TaxID=2819183 RepID=UPI001BEAAE6D|nr:Uma2 family endonuclease [Streptomyces sp. ISL-43]MBT2446281.1 Uma2 family endonuclease [Streptomyces sp. ISL-43]